MSLSSFAMKRVLRRLISIDAYMGNEDDRRSEISVGGASSEYNADFCRECE